MATKKAALEAKPAAKAAPKKVSTELALWEQEMADAAVEQGSKEQHVGGFKSISLKGGILSIDDNAVDDNELRVIILSSVHENQHYDGPYNPNIPNAPTCYAFGDNEDEMAPHEKAPDKQAELCSSCWANEWGSADIGKGKACGNVRRLVCITEDALESPEALMEAEARMLKVPVMSVKNWINYAKNTLAEEVKRPCYGVITLIKLVPDAKAQFKVQFRFEELIDFNQDLYNAMKKRAASAREESTQAYPVFEEEEKPAKGGKRVIPIAKAPAAKGKAAPLKAPPVKAGGRGGKY